MGKFSESVIFSDRTVFRIGRHLFLFVGMNLLFTWVLMMRGDNAGSLGDAMQNVFINSIFFFGYAYVTAYLLVPRFLTKGRYLLFALLFFLVGITISWLKFIFSDYVFFTAIGGDFAMRIKSPDLSQIVVNTKDMTFIVALFLIVKFARDSYRVRTRLAHLQDDQIRSEIRLLRNQLDPHVVFNNLNNLYTLGVNHSPEVFVNLGRLRSVLAYYFVDGSKSKVKFSRELQAIGDFLDLEKLRYGERLAITYKVHGDPGNREIAPLVLFPFVEKCIKHGSSQESGESWIKIAVIFGPGSVDFSAANSVPEKTAMTHPADPVKISASPVKKLELFYAGKYTLKTKSESDRYCVDLKLII